MKKILCIFILLVLTAGCSKELGINTEYDSLRIEVMGTINAGCNSDEDTYLSHHYKDKHVYELDYKNELEYYANDVWVVYNTSDKQYLSMDRGNTFNEILESDFETSYREQFDELLTYIQESDKEIVEETKDYTIYEVSLIGKKDQIFEIVKKFGITNNDQIINELKTFVTIDSKGNITQIEFNLKTKISKEVDIQNCYDVYWNLSNYNEIKIELPELN